MSKPQEEPPFKKEYAAETEDLERKYQKIGIAAVLAAVRYQHQDPGPEKVEHPTERKPA